MKMSSRTGAVGIQAQGAVRTVQQADQEAEQRARQRFEAYQRQLGGLGDQQRGFFGALQTQASRQQTQLERSLRDLRDQQRAYFDRRCQEIEDDLRLAEEKFDDRFSELTRTLDERFQQERRYVAQQLAEQTKIFQQALDKQRSALQSEIDALKARVQDQQAAASDWLAAAEQELEFGERNYRHEFFCPGEADAIRQRLSMARQNFERGIFQAALAVAQESALQAGLLHQKLELLTQRWEKHRQLALQSLEVGLAALEAHRTFKLSAMEADGAATTSVKAEQEVDTDYWTGGQWGALQQRLAEMRWRISHEQAEVSFEELARMQQAGEEAVNQAVALAASAKYALMASVLRADLQRRFCDRLAQAGYQVADNAWAGNDERRSNHVVLRGVNGDEIAIVLAPKEECGKLSNRIQVHFRDPSPNEAERREKLDAIRKVLSEVYEVPDKNLELRCLPGTELESNAADEHFDLERVRREEKKGVAQSGRSRL